MSERKSNRGKIEIMGDVLALTNSSMKKTHIMYKANLSYEQLHLYLDELLARQLVLQDVSRDGTFFRTTERGREFLQHYHQLSEFLKEPEILEAPYLRG
jgi:predicted transcriptional regulator